jgi:predicted TIM-barrel fold metal-dependent hydrolase
MRPYRLVSADSHVVEPPDIWTRRMPARLRDRAPRQQRFDEGDAWVIEGLTQPFPFGLTQCGGLPPEAYRMWVRWEEVRPGAWVPSARIREMDQGKVDAEVLYPSPRIQNAIIQNRDAEWQIACVRAYNDWLSEFCAYDPARFVGIPMLPSVGIAGALAELARASALPGLRGALVSQYPEGGVQLSPADDPLFAACEERGIAVHLHVGLSGSPAGTPALAHGFQNAFTGAFRFYDPPVRMSELVYHRVLDRFPGLEVVFAEVDCGWVGYLIEQLDDRFARQNPKLRIPLDHLPSEYFQRRFSYGIVKDAYGIRNRHSVGVERILWSSDYPHATCDWPDFDAAIERDFAGVPEHERRRILCENAARLYGLRGAGA